jgi:hypothetical protein
MTSYQGASENPSQNLYGIQWTVTGILISIARLGFNTFGNFLDTGGLGTVLKSVVFSTPLEYRPNYSTIALSTVLVALIAVTLVAVVVWLFNNVRNSPFLKLLTAWLIAYYIFNFYWNDSSDQFWMQTLPVMWLMMLFYAGVANLGTVSEFDSGKFQKLLNPWGIRILVLLIAIVNTLQHAYPLAFANLEQKTIAHERLLKPGDLEIITGWDELRWLSVEENSLGIERVILMSAALGNDPRLTSPGNLSEMIEKHLKSGNRVIVARLFEKDHTPRPWDQLAKLGWSRKQLIKSLSTFEHREIARIDDVVFHELILRNRQNIVP